MSLCEESGSMRHLSIIESPRSEPIVSASKNDASEMSTERKDFGAIDIPSPGSYSAGSRPDIPSRISTLDLDPSIINSSQDGNYVGKDVEKVDNVSSDSSTPMVAEVADHGRQDPFAEESEGGVQYRTMTWWQAGMVMIAETVSLGILSLPSAISTLGLIPGLVLLIALGLLATYTGHIIGQFKLCHPHIHSMADAGSVLFGRVGGEILGAGQLLFMVFIMGSHILTFSIMMNAITSHGACTVVFMAVGATISFLLTIPRTLKNLSWWSITSFISIIAAVTITMVGVSISQPGRAVEVALWPNPDVPFYKAFLAVANIIFAYAGHVAFFTFISELRKPEDFPKALCLLQGSDVTMYLVSAVVIYCYAGENVKSPALDSAGPIVRKVAYGVALPTIVVAGVVNGHVAVKYLYVRLFRDSSRAGKGKDNILYQRTLRARGIWVGINATLWVVAWVIAEGIPVFNDLLGLTSALFASWFTFGLSGLFWFSMNRGQWCSSWSKIVNSVIAGLCFAVGLLICVIGIYASSMSIRESSRSHMAGGSFSCADNSGARLVGELDGDKTGGIQGRGLILPC